MNIQVITPGIFLYKKEIGLCLKANKSMLPSFKAVSEAIPG